MPPPLPGPPYPPTTQALGQVPSPIPDIPVCTVFLIVFAVAGAGHMTLFFRNKKRGHRFVFNALCFGFTMSRVTSTLLRTAWACHPRDVRLGIASEVFVNLGVTVLFVVNLLFAQRLVRGRDMRIGWSRGFSVPVYVSVAVLVLVIPLLIASVILEFYAAPTPGSVARGAAAGIQKAGAVIYAVAAVAPIVIVGTSEARARGRVPVDGFGKGSWAAKVVLVLVPAVLLSVGAVLRAVVACSGPVLIRDPQPWYLSKASFYCFDFGIEASVVWLWLGSRIDQRFYVPDGARGGYADPDELLTPLSPVGPGGWLTFEAMMDERAKIAEEEGIEALGVMGEISVTSTKSSEESRIAASMTTMTTAAGSVGSEQRMACKLGKGKNECALCTSLYS